MAVESREKPEVRRKRLAEMKQHLLDLPLADRIAEEVRQARELGITVTASEAAAIGRPIERRARVAALPLPDVVNAINAHSPEMCREHGVGTDLGARGTFAAILRTSPFAQIGLASSIRDDLKKLSESASEDLVTRLSSQLDLLRARGDSPELIRQAKKVFAQSVFASAKPAKSKKGLGGSQNRD